MSDLRTSRDRDAALHAQIVRDGGISLTVLCANRDHAASLHRLIASGRIRVAGSGWIGVEQERESLRDILRDWARRARVWLVGEESV